MRALLLTLSVSDPASLRAALGAALGTASVDLCQATEGAITWLENRPCDLIAVAGHGTAVVEAVARVRRVSRTIPVLVVVPDPSEKEAGAAWLTGADDVITATALVAGTLPEGLDEVRHPERDVLRRTQRLWYAGAPDALRQQLMTRLGARFREVGLSAEGLAGLTTQDVEAPQSAALLVNALVAPEALVLGVRRVKRTYPALAITVVADAAHHDAFRRAGADECAGPATDADPVLHAVGRAQAACRAVAELDAVRARETRLRALLEHLPEAVLLVSPEHAVLAVNLAALRLLGAQDARQVLGSPLTSWFRPDQDQADGAEALVDSAAAGHTRELFARTRHLADPRRLQLRAVPFQRESGGPPAALVVLREFAESAVVATLDAPPLTDTTTVDALRADLEGATQALEQARQQADDDRRAFEARLVDLDAELDAARAVDEDVRQARAALAAAQADVEALQEARARVAALEAELADAQAELQSAQQALDDATQALMDARTRIDALESTLADMPEPSPAPEPEPVVSVAEFEAVRDAAAAAVEDRDRLADGLGEALARIAALEAAEQRLEAIERDLEHVRHDRDRLAEALAQAEARRAALVEPQADVVASRHQRLLQEIAQVGLIRTTTDGDIVDANGHAAWLCGVESPTALQRNGLPAPLALLAEAEGDVARFEVCVQGAGTQPRWIAGARLAPDAEVPHITWLLAEASTRHADPAVDPGRPELLTDVLDVVAAECATIVDEGATPPPGPRPVDAPEASPVAAQALDRARLLLGQVAGFRKRRQGRPAIDELREHLLALDPVLARLATDDVTWTLTVPDQPLHVGAGPAEVERCLTALVSATRDALPLGGRLALTVTTPQPASGLDTGDIRRLDVALALEAQGYGVSEVTIPEALHEMTVGMGGTIAVTQTDGLTRLVVLRLPRAFVISNAA